MINHPNRKSSPIVDTVRHLIGRRHEITRAEMRHILADLGAEKLVDLGNGWGGSNPMVGDEVNAAAWERTCEDMTVISILAEDDPIEPRLRSSNPGTIRYDVGAGSMHPMLRASLMFVPSGYSHDLDYLRRRAKRLLIVRD